MNAPQKVPVAIPTGSFSSGKATLPGRILSEQRGTGRVHGPEQGYVRCERKYPVSRRLSQRSQ
jgi:hypothetical protein